MRLDMTHRPLGRLSLDCIPLGTINMGAPAGRLDLSPRPLGLLRLPIFPASADDLLTAGGGEFLSAGGGETLSW